MVAHGEHGEPGAEGRTVMSSKGQVVLPKAIRERLGWHEGDAIAVEAVDDRVVLRRHVPDRIDPEVARRAIAEIAGSLAHLRRRKGRLSDAEVQTLVTAAADDQDRRSKGKRRTSR